MATMFLATFYGSILVGALLYSNAHRLPIYRDYVNPNHYSDEYIEAMKRGSNHG